MFSFRMDPGVYVDGQNCYHVDVRSSEAVSKALDHKTPSVRYGAIQSPYFGPEHMEKAVTHIDPVIRTLSLASPHLSLEHLKILMNDKGKWVRETAERIAKERGWNV